MPGTGGATTSVYDKLIATVDVFVTWVVAVPPLVIPLGSRNTRSLPKTRLPESSTGSLQGTGVVGVGVVVGDGVVGAAVVVVEVCACAGNSTESTIGVVH